MKLEESFYIRNTLDVARDLLGCTLVHVTSKGIVKGRILETEAYMGVDDKGAHSYGGRHTPRMDPLYKKGGFAYIYQLHGYNYCFNVVTENKNIPHGVLVRNIEPSEGLELMIHNRRFDVGKGKNMKNLTNGPSKLCQAMDIDKSLNGIDLCGNELYILSNQSLDSKEEVLSAKRVNIDYADEFKDVPWRFLLKKHE